MFQDFVRFELTLRENVVPRETGGGWPVALDEVVNAALAEAGAGALAGLDTVLAKGYSGGTELSGGQWQRVALARALAAVRLGAGLVLLDEPTAQLDVRGEAEIFERVLAATRSCTTILISHRFSTVRHVDRIAVVEHGAVVELGSHDGADGAARPVLDDVLPAGAAVRGGDARGRRGGGDLRCPHLTRRRRPGRTGHRRLGNPPASTPHRRPGNRRTSCRPRSPRCGGCAVSASGTSRR